MKTLGVGGLAGFTSCVILQPFDLLKTRMQQEHGYLKEIPESRTQRLQRHFRQVIQVDGWRGLWRGTVPTIVRNVPGVAAYFYTINELRWLVAVWQVPLLSVRGATQVATSQKSSKLARLSTTGNLLTGAAARVAIGFFLNPITLVKARYESSHYARTAYPSIASSLRAIYREAGFSGFFRGFSATALRDAPYAGLYLAVYEQTKQSLGRLTLQDRSGNAWVVSASGLTAGTLATIFTQPFDILKTRMQTTPSNMLNMPAEKVGIVAMTRHVLATDGIGAFADGLGLRCARKAASGMIAWTIFEFGNRWYSS
ncbi:hypothetical protein MYAM1_003905 [Malassezia yamatoensis]|uniref:Solute carrier family 25 member 38 homolog n=1 Tax=Malassezia yamatoensis TaxID=253288 RepID=A0AAJ6CJT8_9BASI|nr:hypothetical protein MYAM1_003905 [Malassezia yamatoensis]